MITKFSPRSVKVTYCYNFNIVTDRLANQPTNHVPSYGPQQEGFEEWLECLNFAFMYLCICVFM